VGKNISFLEIKYLRKIYNILVLFFIMDDQTSTQDPAQNDPKDQYSNPPQQPVKKNPGLLQQTSPQTSTVTAPDIKQQTQQQPTNNPVNTQQPNPAQPENKKMKWWMWLIIGAVVVIIATATYYFFFL